MAGISGKLKAASSSIETKYFFTVEKKIDKKPHKNPTKSSETMNQPKHPKQIPSQKMNW